MRDLAEAICNIMYDYHSQHGFRFTPEHVIRWVSQFEESDQRFILEEFLHLLNQGIYVSEAQAKGMLIEGMKFIAKENKLKDVPAFLQNAEFIKMQTKGKSQDTLLNLLNEELVAKYGVKLSECGNKSKKFAVYIDDILATGNTVVEDCKKWLELVQEDGESNFDKVTKKEKLLIVYVFCRHEWPNIDWKLREHFDDSRILDKIRYVYHFKVENHFKRYNQRFNVAYPTADQPREVLEYLDGLEAKSYREYALRKDNSPTKEEFFSSPQNRIRFENILVVKGIELLKKVVTLSRNHRPLGAIYPSYKTLGTGTLYFTWRNISNTTPIVFWWKVHWYPLFPLDNRGN